MYITEPELYLYEELVSFEALHSAVNQVF